MKQNLLNKLWLRVGMIVAIMTTALAGQAWADEETVNFSEKGYGNGDAVVTYKGTSFTITFDKGTNSNGPKYYDTGAAVRVYGGNYFTVSSEYTIEEIVLTFATTGDGSNEITTDVGTYKTDTWTGSSNSVTFTIGGTSGHRRIAAITVTYVTGGVPKVATPIISGESIFCESTDVTITCATEGATIQYSLDDGVNWTNYSDPITITETKTVKAKASKKDMEDSDVASKLFNMKMPLMVVRALGAIDLLEDNGTMPDEFVQGKISQIDGFSSGSITYYISDDGTTASQLEVYKGKGLEGADFAAVTDLNVGDEVIVFGTLTKYVDKSGKVIPEFKAGSKLVSYIPSTTPVPTLTVSKTSLTGFTYAQGDGPSAVQTFEVTGTNLTGDVTLTMDNEYYEMSVSEDANYASSLIRPKEEVGIKSVFVRLKAGLDVNESYSGKITITSAGAAEKTVTLGGSVTEYVPDYAELPFEFDGGRSDIANTAGLTQEGLDSDYGSSPKLKFNSTGDYVILKFNEEPGVLTYDIKGNSFKDGTFTVQTSADGTNYETLKKYTALTTVESESFSLASTVRYIKWIYTEKVNGNVALGNIKLGKPGEATPTLIVTKTSLEGFTYVQENGPSEVQDFDVSGENLVGDVTLEVSEPSFFEISVSETTNFDTKLVLHKTEVDGSKKIFVRLKAGYPQDNSYSGYIQINSQGAEEKVVYLNGSVTPSALEDPYFVWNLTTNSYIDASEDQVSWLSFFASMIAERYDNTKTKANNYLGGDANARTSSRFYNGSTLTITPSKGYTITSVEFLATSASYAAALKECTWINATASVDDLTVTVTPTDGSAAFYAKIGGTVGVETVTYYISKDITIDETGYATYIAPANVKFPSGLTAYVVSEVKNNEASLQKVTAVAEGTPVILKGEGTYTVEVVAYEECDKIEENMLVGSFGTDKGDGTIYILAKVNSSVAFFPVGEGSVIPAGRAYLQVPASEAGAKAFYFSFEDGADGINSLTPALSEGEGAIYNLAGQRISKMQKGINIVNGKKIAIK